MYKALVSVNVMLYYFNYKYTQSELTSRFSSKGGLVMGVTKKPSSDSRSISKQASGGRLRRSETEARGARAEARRRSRRRRPTEKTAGGVGRAEKTCIRSFVKKQYIDGCMSVNHAETSEWILMKIGLQTGYELT